MTGYFKWQALGNPNSQGPILHVAAGGSLTAGL